MDAFLVSCDIIRLQLSLCRNLDQIEFSDIQIMRSDSISEPLLVETSRPLDPIKDAINRVADRLNISKHTVYLYIRQRKTEDDEKSSLARGIRLKR